MGGKRGSAASTAFPILIFLAIVALIVAGVFLSREEAVQEPPARPAPPVRIVKPREEKPPEVRAPEPKPVPVPAPAKPPESPREKARKWLKSRPVPMPALAYLFDADNKALEPLGGTMLREKDGAESYRLEATGPVYLSKNGAVFIDGSRLLSTRAGQDLSRLIKSKKVLSVEAVITPADTHRGGPARIVSISYDGGVRNFTLGQENDDWVVRLRTTKTDGNGTNPQLNYDKTLGTRRTHVVFTYDGNQETIHIDGRKVAKKNRITGDLSNWDTRFPLVFGNEAYDVRNWEGVIRFAAFYDRVLAPGEVEKLAKALPSGDPPLGRITSPPPKKPPLEEPKPEPPVQVEDVF